LGFEDDNSYIETRHVQLRSGQLIATGDLICYGTPSNQTSCCVHLKPSISNTRTIIPYARCKCCLRVANEIFFQKTLITMARNPDTHA
jgi:hypothetical protein